MGQWAAEQRVVNHTTVGNRNQLPADGSGGTT